MLSIVFNGFLQFDFVFMAVQVGYVLSVFMIENGHPRLCQGVAVSMLSNDCEVTENVDQCIRDC